MASTKARHALLALSAAPLIGCFASVKHINDQVTTGAPRPVEGTAIITRERRPSEATTVTASLSGESIQVLVTKEEECRTVSTYTAERHSHHARKLTDDGRTLQTANAVLGTLVGLVGTGLLVAPCEQTETDATTGEKATRTCTTGEENGQHAAGGVAVALAALSGVAFTYNALKAGDYSESTESAESKQTPWRHCGETPVAQTSVAVSLGGIVVARGTTDHQGTVKLKLTGELTELSSGLAEVTGEGASTSLDLSSLPMVARALTVRDKRIEAMRRAREEEQQRQQQAREVAEAAERRKLAAERKREEQAKRAWPAPSHAELVRATSAIGTSTESVSAMASFAATTTDANELGLVIGSLSLIPMCALVDKEPGDFERCVLARTDGSPSVILIDGRIHIAPWLWCYRPRKTISGRDERSELRDGQGRASYRVSIADLGGFVV